MFFPSLLAIATVVLDLFALTDIMNSKRDTFSKIVLIILVLLFPIFAAGIYLLVFREKNY